MSDIETPNLILRLVPLAGLAAIQREDIDAARRIIGPSFTREWFETAWVAGLRLQQWKDNLDYAPWSIRAIVSKESGDIVGNVNCHDCPRIIEVSGQEGLMIEVGYTVFKPWRRRGIAAEATLGLANFAREFGVRWIRLSISPENVPSLGLARKMGAYKIGSQIDDIDGPEDIFLLDIGK